MKLKVQGLGGGAQISPRWTGSWAQVAAEKDTAWERKADESPGPITACYGYYQRGCSAAGWKLPNSYKEPPFSSGHLTVPVNLKV